VTQLSDLYDADLRQRSTGAKRLSQRVRIPHPLHGVEYADGVILCGRADCTPCRDYRRNDK